MYDAPRFTKPTHSYGEFGEAAEILEGVPDGNPPEEGVDLSHCATLGGATPEEAAAFMETLGPSEVVEWAGEGFTGRTEESTT